jgi:hypothetical protein
MGPKMQPPKIQTAIPQARYRLGDYQAVLLGDIESPDAARYVFILALVREGESVPTMFVIAEKNPRLRAQEGSHRLRVVSEQFNEDLGSSDRWREADVFAREALRVAARLLGVDAGPEPS